jgi:hypothetical protein
MRIPDSRTVDFSILKSQFKTIPKTHRVFKVQVLDVNGGQARLLYDGRTITAHIDERGLQNLTNGEILSVRILSDVENTMILQAVDRQTPTGLSEKDCLASLLNKFGYRANSSNLFKARLLVTFRLPVTEEMLQAMDQSIKLSGLKEKPASSLAAAINLSRFSEQETMSLSDLIKQFDNPSTLQSFLNSLREELLAIFSSRDLLPGTKQYLAHQFAKNFLESYLIDLPSLLGNDNQLSLESRLFNLSEKMALVLARLMSLGFVSAKEKGVQSNDSLRENSYLKGKQEDFLKANLFQLVFNDNAKGAPPFYYFSLPTEFRDDLGLFNIFYFPNEASSETIDDKVRSYRFLFNISDTELGSILFDIKLKEQNIRLEINANEKSTFLLIKKNLKLLRSMMAKADYNLSDVVVLQKETSIIDRASKILNMPIRTLDISI